MEAVNDGKIASWEMHRYLQVDFKMFVKILVKILVNILVGDDVDGVQTRY